jgi:hypothetical protein
MSSFGYVNVEWTLSEVYVLSGSDVISYADVPRSTPSRLSSGLTQTTSYSCIRPLTGVSCGAPHSTLALDTDSLQGHTAIALSSCGAHQSLKGCTCR